MSLAKLFIRYFIAIRILELILSILIPIVFFFYLVPIFGFSFILYHPQLFFFRLFLVFFVLLNFLIRLIKTITSIKEYSKLELTEKPLIIPKIKGIQPSGERIVAALFGVAIQFNRTVLNPDTGTVESKNPENSIIITNKRIIFAVIPMFGQGKFIDGYDMTLLNWFFGKKYIKKKGEEMIGMMSPQEILESDKHNFEISLDQLKEVKIKNFFDRSFIFFTNDGKKFKYVTTKKEHITQIRDILGKYIIVKQKINFRTFN